MGGGSLARIACLILTFPTSWRRTQGALAHPRQLILYVETNQRDCTAAELLCSYVKSHIMALSASRVKATTLSSLLLVQI